MKKDEIYEAVNWVRKRPDLKRKIKIFSLAAVAFLVLLSGLAIGLGIAAFRAFDEKIQSVQSLNLSAPAISEKVTEQLAKIDSARCLDKAIILLNPGLWVSNPISYNIGKLKLACLNAQDPLCHGNDCENIQRQIQTAESEFTI